MFRVQEDKLYRVTQDNTYVTIIQGIDEVTANKIATAMNEQEIKHNAEMARTTTVQTQRSDVKNVPF